MPDIVEGIGRYAAIADAPFNKGFLSKEAIATLQEELVFQRAVQSYIWMLPAINMYGMKEGSESAFGKGYNVLPIFKDRLNAKTLVTTPNSDVIYAMGYVDLHDDGPIVIEVPPGLQGILDDFFQRPIGSEGTIDGRAWSGDVGLPGPDKGKGGKYLLLPPDYAADVPEGYLTFRSRTYGVFVFWRGFFKDPTQLDDVVAVMERTRIYPLGKEATAKPMEFPNASNVAVNMLYPSDGTAFDMIARFIDHEYADPKDMEMRGMLAALGIEKGKPFQPDDRMRNILDTGAKAAYRITRSIIYEPLTIVPNALWYEDRRWANVFPGNATFTGDTFNYIDPRTGFFAVAYSASPGMAVNMENVGAKYPVTFVDSNDDFLIGFFPLQVDAAQRRSRGPVLVGDRIRPGDRLRARQRTAIPIHQYDGRACNERGRIYRYLLWTRVTGRRQELATDCPRSRLLRDSSYLRTDKMLLRSQLEAE